MIPLAAILYAVVVMLVGAIGAYYFKRASETISLHPIKLLKNWRFILAAVLYVTSAAGYLTLLKRYPLSIIYPLVSITYIWVAILSVWLLKERMNRLRIIGIILIIVGVILLTSA